MASFDEIFYCHNSLALPNNTGSVDFAIATAKAVNAKTGRKSLTPNILFFLISRPDGP